ncbi:MAG: imidazole glycerol phosphate synthase subunit HisH [Nitrospina sp.]|nr:imidazole glycerol phosphate synthase subunit HisH [Nitrospina sp.]MBT5969269.1 imidazole glycerol phosphate synthase subunit HisH [Nitrospina sp.]MBT6662240.1 imidazole glycerol phosphate synthase subunit HisH [Nitrospina sp.]MBT7271723.1 imidazole glycerol phosphate synthase subunit HisH [Nitrospina sp.]MBT7521244.1 imidazole glycerol phosphate synthase subunit HisH [Nitrospina sp.]
MIAVIDYGMGNLRSVQKSLEFVGAKVVVTHDPDLILNADSVVLPGVGSFKDCMSNLKELNLIDPIRKFIDGGKPFLGICLGLQVLFEESEEYGPVAGLGILPGKVVKFSRNISETKNGQLIKVPHMGWNKIEVKKKEPLFENIDVIAPYFYFVHSYYVVPKDKNMVATVTNYGIEFVSGIQYKNIYAFQFHPEKSQTMGLALLERFSNLN